MLLLLNQSNRELRTEKKAAWRKSDQGNEGAVKKGPAGSEKHNAEIKIYIPDSEKQITIGKDKENLKTRGVGQKRTC